MKRHLFLTGPMGCGKSTAITVALGANMEKAGGFLTRRNGTDKLYFTLESPDGSQKETFLDFREHTPQLDLSVFGRLGASLLAGDFLVLDEIGGIELLNPDFMAALEQVLCSDIPILGVLKAEGPASKLMDTLQLSDAYLQASAQLRHRLQAEENTLVYSCGQFDPQAKILAENWVKEYCP